MKYLKEIVFFGPVAYLLNPDVYPSETHGDGTTTVAPSGSVYGPGINLLMKFIQDLILKYNSEKLGYSDEKIRELIEVRNEKERQNVIKELDDLTEEMRGIEMTKKFLGMGKWAFGASKAVYAYDPDRWDKERGERERAGISDFPGVGPDGEFAAAQASGAAAEEQIFADGFFGDSAFYDNLDEGYTNGADDGEA